MEWLIHALSWCWSSLSLVANRGPMMTSSNENIFRITWFCAGNWLLTGEFPSHRPVTWSFDVFYDLRLNKQLSKQSWGWWFEMPSRSWWCHCNAISHIVLQCKNVILKKLSLLVAPQVVSDVTTSGAASYKNFNHLDGLVQERRNSNGVTSFLH